MGRAVCVYMCVSLERQHGGRAMGGGGGIQAATGKMAAAQAQRPVKMADALGGKGNGDVGRSALLRHRKWGGDVCA